MKMDRVAGSGNDEFYTPGYAVRPILEYIPKGSKVWCPFDTEESMFVKMIIDNGSSVVCTHIHNQVDFLEKSEYTDMIIEECDFIISNPPYSIKADVFERLFEIGKPFAMLVGVVGLFESQRRFDIFRDNKFEIMYMNRRVSYFKDYSDMKPSLNPPFSSVYICKNILEDRIVFKEIDKKSI